MFDNELTRVLGFFLPLTMCLTACVPIEPVEVTRPDNGIVTSPTAAPLPTTSPLAPVSTPETGSIVDNRPSVRLPLADYPPSNTPYLIRDHNFWLVHTPQNELFAFVRTSPPYAGHISVDECGYDWIETVQRFIDPCSGDEWTLNGTLDLERSTELWSDRDLDQHPLSVQDGMILVQLDRIVPGMPMTERRQH